MTRALAVLLGLLLLAVPAASQQVPNPLSRSAACPSIVSYGGSPGSTNNAPAFNAAVAAAVDGRICVSFPPGKFNFTSALAVTVPDVASSGFTLQGAGSGVTILNWPNAAGGLGITLTNRFQSFRVIGAEFTTAQNGGGTAINVISTSAAAATALQPTSVIDSVNIHGADGYSTNLGNYWNTAIKLTGITNVNIVNSSISGNTTAVSPAVFAGIGIDLVGAVANHAAAINVIGTAITCVDTALRVGSEIEGVTVSGGSNFVCGRVGIHVPAGGTGRDQLVVTGSHINMREAGIKIEQGIASTIISNNLFILGDGTEPNAIGVNIIDGGGTLSVTDNSFQSGTSGSFGLKIDAGIGVVGGNTFQFITGGTGISLGSTQMRVRNDNTFAYVDTPFVGHLTNSVDGSFGWTPFLYGSTTAGAPVYTSNSGSITRNGSKISAHFTLTGTSIGGAAGELRIGGIPLNALSYATCSIVGGGVTIAAGVGSNQFLLMAGIIEPSTTAIRVHLGSSAPTGSLQPLTTVSHTVGPAFNWFGTCDLLN